MTYPHPEPQGEIVPAAEATPFDSTGVLTFAEIQRCAKMFLASGLFSIKAGTSADSQIAQLAVKIMAGQELGIGAYASARGIDIINGQITPDAGLTAALVKRSGRYFYHVSQWDALGCLIDWFERRADEWLPLGKSGFTIEEAKTAGLMGNNVWHKYPKAMCWARAMTQGARAYCPDVFLGAVYSREELGGEPAPQDINPPERIEVMHDAGNGAMPGAQVVDTTVATVEVPAEPVEAVARTVRGPSPEHVAGTEELLDGGTPSPEPGGPEHWTPLIEAATTDEELAAMDKRVRAETPSGEVYRKANAIKAIADKRRGLAQAAQEPQQSTEVDADTTSSPEPLQRPAETPPAGEWHHPMTGEIHPEPANDATAVLVLELAQAKTIEEANAIMAEAKVAIHDLPAQWRYVSGVYTDRCKAINAENPPPKKKAPSKAALRKSHLTYGEGG